MRVCACEMEEDCPPVKRNMPIEENLKVELSLSRLNPDVDFLNLLFPYYFLGTIW